MRCCGFAVVVIGTSSECRMVAGATTGHTARCGTAASNLRTGMDGGPGSDVRHTVHSAARVGNAPLIHPNRTDCEVCLGDQ